MRNLQDISKINSAEFYIFWKVFQFYYYLLKMKSYFC